MKQMPLDFGPELESPYRNLNWYSDNPETDFGFFHRRLGPMVRGIDLDMVGHCRWCLQRLYVVEATRSTGVKPWTMTREIASHLDAAALLVRYSTEERCDCVPGSGQVDCGHGLTNVRVDSWRKDRGYREWTGTADKFGRRLEYLHIQHETQSCRRGAA